MAHDVFVSYSSKDKAVADAIVASMENKSIRCWVAPRDIKPGKDWGNAIADAIAESKVFLLVFSNHSNQSQRVLDELNLAISEEIVVLPFRIEKLEPSGAMRLHLSTRHWLDAYEPSWKKHIDELVETVSINIKDGSKGVITAGKTITSDKRTTRFKAWIWGIPAALGLIVGSIFAIRYFTQAQSSAPGGATTTFPLLVSPSEETMESEITATANVTESIPIGSINNPITWMYTPPQDIPFSEISTISDTITQQFQSKYPQLKLTFIPANNNLSIVEALCDGEAHIGSMGSFSYLYASNQDCATAKFIWASEQVGLTYKGMIFANSMNNPIDDISELEGKKLCIPNYESASGWALPSLWIRSKVGDPSTFFSQIIIAGSHPHAVEMVYNGDCEAGTAYFDAREAVNLENVNQVVTIIGETDPIPMANISFSTLLDPELSGSLMDFLAGISRESDQLARLCGQSVELPPILSQINDYYFDSLRELFNAAGADPKNYISYGN
jgi:phosphate/phosphite/phosphonate ABC transporter binding protein